MFFFDVLNVFPSFLYSCPAESVKGKVVRSLKSHSKRITCANLYQILQNTKTCEILNSTCLSAEPSISKRGEPTPL